MWVADERKDEYLAAGHKLAATPSVKAQVEESEEDEQPKPEKKPAKKPATKKR